jgi:hypothetical protein
MRLILRPTAASRAAASRHRAGLFPALISCHRNSILTGARTAADSANRWNVRCGELRHIEEAVAFRLRYTDDLDFVDA